SLAPEIFKLDSKKTPMQTRQSRQDDTNEYETKVQSITYRKEKAQEVFSSTPVTTSTPAITSIQAITSMPIAISSKHCKSAAAVPALSSTTMPSVATSSASTLSASTSSAVRSSSAASVTTMSKLKSKPTSSHHPFFKENVTIYEAAGWLSELEQTSLLELATRRKGIFSKAGRVFSDFRDKFNKALRTLVKNYNNLAEEVEVSEFIDDNVWQLVLSSHLDATKKMELMDDHHILFKLREFVQAAFAIHLHGESDASLAVKGLDYITINLKIPTQLNIVSEMD
ncbi:3184_t:CDS:2, partial [Paraglomus brasilianum]